MRRASSSQYSFITLSSYIIQHGGPFAAQSGVTKYNIAARRHQPSPFLVCVRLRQRSLHLLAGLFTHKSLRDGPRRRRLGVHKQDSSYERKKSRQERSGDHAGQFTGPPHPIHHPGYAVSNALRTSALKCASAPSCWNYIRALLLAETL
ncbi:hypothetical protein TNCV_1177551 [Trichonephila clavipes]|nr:hypothetical protein TNCV_1177551 [Trichonephila clavipes]